MRYAAFVNKIFLTGLINWLEYVERYQPQYGSGLIPESVPMLLE